MTCSRVLLAALSCLVLLAPVVGYFHLTGAEQRLASRQFLGRVLKRQPQGWECYRHALDFGNRGFLANPDRKFFENFGSGWRKDDFGRSKT